MGKLLPPKLETLQIIGFNLILWAPAAWYLFFGFLNLIIHGFYLNSYPYYFLSGILGILLYVSVIFVVYNNPRGKIISIICCFAGLIGLVIIPMGILGILGIKIPPLDFIPTDAYVLYVITSIMGIIGSLLDWIGFQRK